MASIFKSSFLRLFTTGFVAGMIGMVALQPADAVPASPAAPVVGTR